MPVRTNQIDYSAQQTLIAALRDGHCFPHAAKTVRVIETHISWVLLAGRYAYKIKKALDLGFLDYTTLDARRFCCDEEVRLNRRLAPKIYLDVVAIGGSPEQPEFDAQPVLEYAVCMRRFATANQMDRLLARGKITPQHIDKLAALLAAFHSDLPRAEAGSKFGSAATIRDESMQNFTQLQMLLTDQAGRDAVAGLEQIAAQEFTACANIFTQRRAQGFVRECHGDLHLGNIVLIGDELVPFDGIEFSPALRWIDVMDEAAFLVMDLLHRQRADLAYRFLNAWLEATGDYAGVAVLRFYLAYRATVRAKVAAIRASQAGRARKHELAACRDYLTLAYTCFTRRRALIITHGLPGSGKSMFARSAAEHWGAIRIRSDVERKRLFGMRPLDSSRSATGEGIYTADATRRTYARLLELARGLLDAGFPVIVDAAFLRQDEREQFRALARDMDVPFAIASMRADAAMLRARIVQRRDKAHDASEADLDVLQALQVVQQPLLAQESACAVELNGGEDAAGRGRLEQLLAGRTSGSQLFPRVSGI
ncbi:MAG: AAA family ATPase [Nitrosomonadales bacterium]|nr:AAA family ATPase [Nitrosomonadales bacterium]